MHWQWSWPILWLCTVYCTVAVALIWLCVAVAISLCVLTVGLLVYRRYVVRNLLMSYVTLWRSSVLYVCITAGLDLVFCTCITNKKSHQITVIFECKAANKSRTSLHVSITATAQHYLSADMQKTRLRKTSSISSPKWSIKCRVER